jgi:Zn-dependent peptidase ImmA (M78 family)
MRNKAELKEKSQELLKYNNTYPVEVIKIANGLGYRVFALENSQGIAGKVCHKDKIIYINPSDNPQRQRFTIAHEIGHIVLHRNTNHEHHRPNDDMTDTELNIYSDDIEEIEANRFAAMLLMPDLEFQQAWSKFAGQISQIANYFNVSKLAASIRANNLNLLSL